MDAAAFDLCFMNMLLLYKALYGCPPFPASLWSTDFFSALYNSWYIHTYLHISRGLYSYTACYSKVYM